MAHGRPHPHLRHDCRGEAADRAKRDEAVRVVERWNKAIVAGRDMWWSPTTRAGVVAGMPWADVHCPGCRTCRSLDLRTIDRHPLASVGSLVLGLRCTWCGGAAPIPKITGLHASAAGAEGGRAIGGQSMNGAVPALLSQIRQGSVAIIEAPSLMHSRMRAALLGVDPAHGSPRATCATSPPPCGTGTNRPTPPEARQLIERFEAPERRPAGPHNRESQ